MKTRTVFLLVCAVFFLAGYAIADNATLILYYSKTGKTGLVARELQALVPSAQTAEIKSDVGIVKAALWHQLFNRNASIEPLDADLAEYDTIILCSPIWLQKISSPARTVLNTLPLRGKKMQLFVTCAGHFGESGQEVLKEMVAGRGIDLRGMYVIKTGDKTGEEIRKQAREYYSSSGAAVQQQ